MLSSGLRCFLRLMSYLHCLLLVVFSSSSYCKGSHQTELPFTSNGSSRNRRRQLRRKQ